MIVVLYRVRCDQCGAQIDGVEGRNLVSPTVRARATARAAGWVRARYGSRTVDVCPSCSSAGQ